MYVPMPVFEQVVGQIGLQIEEQRVRPAEQRAEAAERRAREAENNVVNIEEHRVRPLHRQLNAVTWGLAGFAITVVVFLSVLLWQHHIHFPKPSPSPQRSARTDSGVAERWVLTVQPDLKDPLQWKVEKDQQRVTIRKDTALRISADRLKGDLVVQVHRTGKKSSRMIFPEQAVAQKKAYLTNTDGDVGLSFHVTSPTTLTIELLHVSPGELEKTLRARNATNAAAHPVP